MTKLFYFSGTGNSLKVAMDLKEHLEDAEIVAIKNIVDAEMYAVDADKVGFVFPIYFYGLPRIVEQFIQKVDLSNTQYIFAIATAMHPDGVVLAQVKSLLEAKERALDYGMYLKMPTNYVSFYEPLKEAKRDALLSTSKAKTMAIAKDILDEKRKIQKESWFYKRITSAESSYTKWHGRVYETDKHFKIEDLCNGCRTCEKVCPVKNIEIMDLKPVFKHRCEQCYGCINLCPKKAIGYAKMKSGRYRHPEISLEHLIGG